LSLPNLSSVVKRLCPNRDTETFDVDAKVAKKPKRTRLHNKMAEAYAGFDEYQRKIERVIPIIVLMLVK